MQTIIPPSLYGLGLALLWGVLAFNNPTITYHLAPLLVAVVIPIGSSLTETIPTRTALMATSIGLALTLGAVIVLGLTEHLAGPSLLPSGGAVVEAVVFGGIGGVGGLAFAIRHHR
jgi:hypothetical protein